MSEFQPLAFDHLIRRMFYEFRREGKIFDLPSRSWGRPSPGMGCFFHGRPAGSPLGPAAGPHTQLAPNIVLCWLGGARMIELKTVQMNDRLEIARPCIDAPNVGYNVEFSQELRLEQSLEEYVKAWMLIRMLEESEVLGVAKRKAPREDLDKPHFYDCIFDLSCGYSLEGIRSQRLQSFIASMKDASAEIDRLRVQIPEEFGALRGIDFDPHIVTTATLSTFHGCPPGEVEGIVEHLLRENRLSVVIKMNPTMLGGEKLQELLHSRMGYSELHVSPSALASAPKVEEAVAMVHRLERLARSLGLHVGVKFSNTLEVENHRGVFPASQKVMYMSGPPLYPIAMELALRFRQAYAGYCQAQGEALGQPPLAVSFSAGVDKHNFADCVACGFLPVTVCTDLLKPGGYARAGEYLAALESAMLAAKAATLEEFVRAGCPEKTGSEAALCNHERIAAKAPDDTHYAKARNSLVPKRLDSHLSLFDCLGCAKCVAVCPNNANFAYQTPRLEIAYENYRVCRGELKPVEGGVFRLAKQIQIANYAGGCNECGNCDTFCPEQGGPFREKPSFFTDYEPWLRLRKHNSFFVKCAQEEEAVLGWIAGDEYSLTRSRRRQDLFCYRCPGGELYVDAASNSVADVLEVREDALVDMRILLALRTLLEHVVHAPQANYLNTARGELLRT